MSSGIVLTGGSSGDARHGRVGRRGISHAGAVGAPHYEGSLADVVCQSRYAAAMGLTMEGAAQRRRGIQARDTRSVWQFFGRMRSWFEKNF